MYANRYFADADDLLRTWLPPQKSFRILCMHYIGDFVPGQMNSIVKSDTGLDICKPTLLCGVLLQLVENKLPLLSQRQIVLLLTATM